MNFRHILLSVFFAAFACSALAQANIDPNQLAIQFNPAANQGLFTSGSNESETTSAILGLEQEAFQILNAKRAGMGLSTLEWSDEIANLARMHSQNMAGHKFFSHKDLDGNTVDDRAEIIGLGEWKAIGENIAYLKGHKNPAGTAVENWMKSTGHRQNVLNERYNQSAIGVAIGPDGSYYFTQVFMLRQ